MSAATMLLRARVVLPLCGPPIPNGAVRVQGRRIVQVGPWRQLAGSGSRGKAVDLGESILLPGLVNAHCHLDYTLMAGHFPPPKVFTDWLELITETKAGWHLQDYRESWQAGAEMLLRTGTTTVGDIEAVPQLLPEMWQRTPLRVLSFLEMIGLTPRRRPEIVLEETMEWARSLKPSSLRVGLSPHAPYTTVPELLRRTGQAARRRRWRVCIHAAESALEYEMFRHASGALFEWLRRSGRPMDDCGHGSPVRHLEACGLLGANLLATHANYLGHGDAALLGLRQAHVVHCPRSHLYFHHAPFALRRLLRAKVNVCLGTDSLASVCVPARQKVRLSMFDEMRTLAERESWLPPRRIVEMATLNGARALGMTGLAGQLNVGAWADLVAIPCPGNESPWEAVVHHRGDVSASLIGGRWALPPEQLAA